MDDRLALIECAGDPGGQCDAQRRERLRVRDIGLAIADPDLDRREREMRPHTPPELGVLVDGTGVVEESDVALVIRPRVECIGDAAAREIPGEDLRPCGVKPVSTPSANGELAERASSSGSQLRSALVTWIARSAPLIPIWMWKPNVVFFQTT